jgi:hypothetical protein
MANNLSFGLLEFTLLLLDPDDKLLSHLLLLLLQRRQVALPSQGVLLREATGLAVSVGEAHLKEKSEFVCV